MIRETDSSCYMNLKLCNLIHIFNYIHRTNLQRMCSAQSPCSEKHHCDYVTGATLSIIAGLVLIMYLKRKLTFVSEELF